MFGEKLELITVRCCVCKTWFALRVDPDDLDRNKVADGRRGCTIDVIFDVKKGIRDESIFPLRPDHSCGSSYPRPSFQRTAARGGLRCWCSRVYILFLLPAAAFSRRKPPHRRALGRYSDYYVRLESAARRAKSVAPSHRQTGLVVLGMLSSATNFLHSSPPVYNHT